MLRGDYNGGIWVIADHQLYRYNQKTGKVQTFGWAGYTVSIHVSEARKVWIASGNGTISHYNAQKGDFTSYDFSKLTGGKEIFTDMILHTVSDTTLLVGNMKKLWLYNYKAGKVVDISKNAAQKMAFMFIPSCRIMVSCGLVQNQGFLF
jgi:ligand-binding sensor domain-containing protein